VQAACTAGAAHEDDGVPRVVPRATATATRWRLVDATEEVAGGSAGSSALYAKPWRAVHFAAVREVGRLPRDQPRQNKARTYQARQHKHRSHEPNCPRISNFQAFRNQRDLLAIHFLNGPGRVPVTYQILLRAARWQRWPACNRPRQVPHRPDDCGPRRRSNSRSEKRVAERHCPLMHNLGIAK
jgi:hypothetical protein